MLPRLILFRGFMTPRHEDREWKEKEEQATEHRQLRCQESSSTTFYPDKVFIRNIAPGVSRELLVSYLENVTGQNPIDLLYSDEPGDVLATFKRKIDFSKVKQRCETKLLNERQLGVWRVPVSNSILVENLSPDTDPDHVSCYFETPRANGGTVLEIKPTPDERKFIIVFKDAKTTEGVLKATHRLGGRELRVSLYVECLGPSGGRTEPYIFVLPPPVAVAEADDLKICFVRKRADMLQSFNESLSEVHAQATVEGYVLKVDCTLTESMHKVDLMADKWRENINRQLAICFDLIRLQRITVEPEIWENVKKAVEESEIKCSDLILTIEEECTFVVLGRRNTKAVAFEQIQDTVKAKTEESELKKLEISDTKKLKKHHLDLVKLSSFPSDIRTLHAGLTVDISFQHDEITFQGQPMAIRDAQVRMYDLIHSVPAKMVTSIPESRLSLLATEQSHEAVMKRLKASGLTATWECHSEGIVVYDLNQDWLDHASSIIETSFKSEFIFFNKLSSSVLKESDWNVLEKMLLRNHRGLLVINRQKSSIFITAFCDIMPAVKGAIRTFVSLNTIYTAVLELSPSRQKYLALFWEEKILSIAQKLAKYKVHITLQDDNRSILIRGTYKGVEFVKRDLISLSEQIICKEELTTRQETVRYLAALETTKELDAIAFIYKCVVSLQPEKCEIKTVSTNQSSGSPHVYAVTGDITQMSVDAVVNAANSFMDHAGGLAGQVVAKGGQEIQEECSRILKTRGKLSEGDVLVSGPGKLPCKSIIHAVGPRYNGGNKGEEECLQATVMECLRTASDLGYTSIALPAISSGIFGYPVRAATRVIVEAVTSFFSANHDTSIRDVRLVDIVPSTVRYFQKALDKTPDGSTLSSDEDEEVVSAEEISEWQEDDLEESPMCVLPYSLSQQENKELHHFEGLHTLETATSLTEDIVEVSDIEEFSIKTIQIPQEVRKLYIYAANQEKIEEFLKELTNVVDEHVVKTEMKDLDKLSQEKRMEICKKHNVELCMDTVPTVKGLSKDVQLMEKEIQSIVKEIESKQQESMIASLVGWYYLEVTATETRRIPFDQRENLLTEDAYQKKEDTVEFSHANGTVYVVNLKEMTRSSKVNPVDRVKVMRNIKADWASCSFLPETWEPQDTAELVKRVPLVKGCPEYKSVEANMMKTIKYPFSTSSIISIERIQNPELYKQYLARKTQMDKQNNGIQSEKTLWHGTSSNSIDNINLYGFNRSFCGKNATYYGLGVYFAVKSRYSMQDTYSTRDDAGRKHMYQCKVLVGYSTKGDDGLKVLPMRQGTVPYDSAADKNYNPSMYVIFHDSQAYPEYLITFQ